MSNQDKGIAAPVEGSKENRHRLIESAVLASSLITVASAGILTVELTHLISKGALATGALATLAGALGGAIGLFAVIRSYLWVKRKKD